MNWASPSGARVHAGVIRNSPDTRRSGCFSSGNRHPGPSTAAAYCTCSIRPAGCAGHDRSSPEQLSEWAAAAGNTESCTGHGCHGHAASCCCRVSRYGSSPITQTACIRGWVLLLDSVWHVYQHVVHKVLKSVLIQGQYVHCRYARSVQGRVVSHQKVELCDAGTHWSSVNVSSACSTQQQHRTGHGVGAVGCSKAPDVYGISAEVLLPILILYT